VTGPTGATGPTGSLPETLPSGKSLHGYWAVSSPGFITTGMVASGEISFPIPLAAPITEAGHTVFLLSTETNPNCPGTFNEPKANAGFLCVFEGTVNTQVGAPFTGIQNPQGENGKTATTGAAIVFTGTELEGHIDVAGTWAVTAP
jgi:hypothetical protein